jgi:hypothetical protein
MIYKFDILLKKTLTTGGIKVVTYSSLLDNPQVFGKAEGYGDAKGELSMVPEGLADVFSINVLYRKHRAQLVGRINADMLQGLPSAVYVKDNDPDISNTEVTTI